MQILPYQVRMIEEHAQLQDRITKLAAFLTANADSIDEYDNALMRQQLGHMRCYQVVLSQRLAKMIKECWNG